MSAFEITVTPTRSKSKKVVESRLPTEVIMAPFSAKSIVQFEDVPVTKCAKRILRIVNPSNEDIKVKITKTVAPEHNLNFEWNENVIPANDKITLEVIWNPISAVACTETMQITDNRNFRKDVMIILKSKTNQPTRNVRKYPTLSSNVSSYTKTLRLKSPTSNMCKQTRMSLPNKPVKKSSTHLGNQSKVSTSQSTRNSTKPKWVNVVQQARTRLVQRQEEAVAEPVVIPTITYNSPLQENHINQINNQHCKTHHSEMLSPIGAVGCDLATVSNKNKENISPITPVGVLQMIDKMNFTPTTETISKLSPKKLDDLASLPTPVSRSYCSIIEQTESQLCPRRISTDYIPDTRADTFDAASLCHRTIVTDKTFDMKQTEVIDVTLEDEIVAVSMETNSLTLNKTTTLQTVSNPRLLSVIEEDESQINAEILHQTYNKSKSDMSIEENLKRDIHLVGIPLHKYSESLKDLSLKSPSRKIAIQGSMPNLNEMETIRSFEHNRYFHQNAQQPRSGMTVIPEQTVMPEGNNFDGNLVRKDINKSIEVAKMDASRINTISNTEFTFNQNEILAQSSVFNLNEIGLKSHKTSPNPIRKIFSTGDGTSRVNQEKVKSPAREITKSYKRRSLDSSLSDAFSSDSLASSCSSTKTQTLKPVMPTSSLDTSPPKRQRLGMDYSFQQPTPVNTSAQRMKSWSVVQPKKQKLSRTLALAKKPVTPRKIKDEPRVMLYDADLYFKSFINPDPFAATTTCDPFLAATMYLDEQAVDKHQMDMKKWLNALVSIPADLEAGCDAKIDVGKLFNEVRQKELHLAMNKEEQSLNYLTKFRLETLRKAAIQLYVSDEMRIPCSKIAVYVNKSAIRIRNDRNLHLDVVMQRNILELLLHFNPLWLRLGLEVVYGEKIHLNSNRDIVALSSFILNRLFRDKFLEQQYSKAYTLSDEYAEHIKKFTLQKILILLLFLDKAKEKQIIKHNPCLFLKKSPFKETREILLRFASEMIANLGDITRELKRLGYVLQHRQMFLDEFDYAFNNLAIDLRDGVRLTRVMEIILLRNDLTPQLRVPAISRLQRIYNVNLALQALAEANFQLSGNIDAAAIVDGYREKTLSLLWQIIYKFRSPKFHAAAKIIQIWWRKLWLKVVIKRRIQHKIDMRRKKAATIIQAAYRGYITRKYVKDYREERVDAITILQKYVRCFLAKRKLYRSVSAIIYIQRWYRAHRLGSEYRCKFLVLRSCTVFVQRCYRRKLLARKLLQLAQFIKDEREKKLEEKVIRIQRYWRSYVVMKQIRNDFQRLKKCTIQMQQKFRAICEMRRVRQDYLEIRKATITVQQRFSANNLMKIQRAEYLQLKLTTIKIQQRRRALLITRTTMTEYQRTRNAVICIQRKWRATLLARSVHLKYVKLLHYSIRLQQNYRATKQMRLKRTSYQELRMTVIKIQRRFRANRQMQKARNEYRKILAATLTLQQRFRANKQMRYWRAKFQGTRTAAVCIQQYFRCYLQMKRQRFEYLKLKENVIKVQCCFRAKLLMRSTRAKYLEKRQKIVTLQRYVRSFLLMKRTRMEYQQKRIAAIKLQRWYRSVLLVRKIKQEYQRKLSHIITIQRKWRATLLARKQQSIYQDTLKKIIYIQQKFRSLLVMRHQMSMYQEKRQAVIVIQRRYRASQEMLKFRHEYLLKCSAAIFIQRKFRAKRDMQQQRQEYLSIRVTIINLQQKFRGRLETQKLRSQFLLLRQSLPNFQAHARGFLARKRFEALMTPEIKENIRRNKMAKIIQRFWRGYRVRKRFQNLRIDVIRQNIVVLKKTQIKGDTLEQNMKDAVRCLRGRPTQQGLEALHVLIKIDRISRMVPHLLMDHSFFLSTFCYGIMAQAIRSEVDKLKIEHCSRIILNLARYNSCTAAHTFQENGLVTIAQMLLRWCDKSSEIFNTLCTLIWVFVQCPFKREIIRKYMTTPDAVYMLRETKKLVARKEKMKQNLQLQKKPIIAVNRNNRPNQHNFSPRALPSLVPDFGIIQKQPYTFVSSVFAFDMILSKLEINNI